jgi:ABC-2 type transport system permease protein
MQPILRPLEGLAMNKSNAIGNPRATWLLLRLQAVRFARQLTGSFRFFRRNEANPKRTATAGKSKQSWLIGSLIALSVVFAFTNLAHQSISNIKETAGTVVVSTPPSAKPVSGPKQSAASKPAPSIRMPIAAAPGFTLPPNVLKAVALQALFFLVAITLLAIGNGELTQQDWDLEWLVTLPVRLSTLLCSRILVRAFVNQMGLYVFLPFLAVLAFEAGHGYAAPLLGLAALVPLLIIAATAQTLVDTGLRLRLGPSQLRHAPAEAPALV